jgi:hypothetical protein
MNGAFVFRGVPAIGDTLRVTFARGDQLYRVEAVTPYVNRQGRDTVIVTLSSACCNSRCGQRFTITVGLYGRIDNRRCDKHATERRRQAFAQPRRKPKEWRKR